MRSFLTFVINLQSARWMKHRNPPEQPIIYLVREIEADDLYREVRK